MAGQVSPGVVIKERDLTNARIDSTIDNVGALVGPFERGPVNQMVNITNEKSLLEYFGKPNSSNAEYWFTATNFLSYGGQLQVVRIGDSNLKNAVTDSASAVLIESDTDYATNHFDGAQSFHYGAKYAGSYGNNISVHVVDHGYDFDLTVSAATTAAAGTTVYQSNGVTGKLFVDPAGGTAVKVFETNGNLVTGTGNLLIQNTGATNTTLDGAVATADATITVTSATGLSLIHI